VMADVRQLCERLGIDDVELCSRLLDEAQLALVPGQPFAAPGFVRLSYAASMDDLKQAVDRLSKLAQTSA
jgi:aspartate aminotransferase